MSADSSPRKLACPSCGAAIPPEARPGAQGICAFCGATYQVPDDQSMHGGVQFQSVGSVTILGDVVGRDKVEMGTSRVSNASDLSQPEQAAKPAGVGGGAEVQPLVRAPAAESPLARLRRWLGRSLSSDSNS